MSQAQHVSSGPGHCHLCAIVTCKCSHGKPLLCLAASWLKSAPKVLLGVCLQPEGFYSASNISGGFVCWMAAGFPEVSSILSTGLLFLQW